MCGHYDNGLENSSETQTERNFLTCRWTDILYTNFYAKIQNNGNFSEKFPIERSVHQGGCASTMYFLICAEVLALELKRNTKIKGIPVQEMINLLGHFADDMDIYLLNDKQSLNEVLNVLANFQKQTGFTVNYDKTQVYRIGSLQYSDASLIMQQVVKWTSEPIKVLGVQIDHDIQRLLQLNYQPIVEKAQGLLKLWAQRNLSLFGKILLINTLVASLFTYKMYVLPSISQDIVKQMNTLFEQFLWNGHKPKIPLKVLQMDKTCEGAGLVDLQKKTLP